MKRNSVLDGLRAIAITTIVAVHVIPWKAGGFGNAMFFVLSGFLCASPFAATTTTNTAVEEYFLKPKNIFIFYFKKACAIIPIYWVTLAVYTITVRMFNPRSLIDNMTFSNVYGHFWFLQQIVVMYLLVPFILLLMYLVKRICCVKYNDLICAGVLFLIAVIQYKYYFCIIILQANGGPQCLRIYLFLCGMMAAYLYRAYRKSGKDWGNLIILRIYIFLWLLSAVVPDSKIPVLGLLQKTLNPSQSAEIGYFILAMETVVGIWCLLIASNSVLSKLVGCKPLAFYGEISVSVYMVHQMFIIMFGAMGINPYVNFVLTIISSIVYAVVAQCFIIKPFGILGRTRKLKPVMEYYRNLYHL